MPMNTIIVRMNKHEQKIFEEYAKMHDKPLSTIMKEALYKRIEDELDKESIRAYEADIQDGADEEVNPLPHHQARG